MWIGILVLCTFGAAALISAGFAIRSAFHGQWHMAIGLSIPAIGLGGALLYLVGPAIWLEVAGNPDLEDLPDGATLVVEAELGPLYAGQVHGGTYYEEGAWLVFQETYDASGNLSGTGGPEDEPQLYSWRGQWKVDGDTICFDLTGTGFECNEVYRMGEEYLSTNHRDEVTSRYRVLPPATGDDAG